MGPERAPADPPFDRLFEGSRTGSGFEPLRRMRDRVESILQVVVGEDGVLVQDFSGRIAYANAPAARLLAGDDVAALLRTPSAELLRGLEIRDEAGQLQPAELPGTAILRGAPAGERTLQITNAIGETRWTTVRILPLHDDRGAVGSSISIFRDVTEQRQTADFREHLLGIASHDLRGPLSAITMAAAVIARRPQPMDPQLARLVGQIQSSADRAARMVRDLLDLTQGRLGGGIPLAPTEVEIDRLVHGIVEEVRAAHPARVIELHCPPAGRARWDPDRISQVIANLLGNAISYGAPERPVTLRVAARAAAVELAVHNHGPAIPADKLARMFEPFARGAAADHAQRSVGLGLYIVKEVVSGHRGAIAVSSDAAAGTTFTVTLPRD